MLVWSHLVLNMGMKCVFGASRRSFLGSGVGVPGPIAWGLPLPCTGPPPLRFGGFGLVGFGGGGRGESLLSRWLPVRWRAPCKLTNGDLAGSGFSAVHGGRPGRRHQGFLRPRLEVTGLLKRIKRTKDPRDGQQNGHAQIGYWLDLRPRRGGGGR
jgi:hypothetical protein